MSNDGNVARLEIKGELNIFTAAELREASGLHSQYDEWPDLNEKINRSGGAAPAAEDGRTETGRAAAKSQPIAKAEARGIRRMILC